MSQPSWIGYELGGRYKIEELLGQGGMAAVYKATDPKLRRVVAVKLIHPHLSTDPEFVWRFEEEAAAVAQLSHPNIVRVFDFNHDDNVYYMVLEFVPGETLQQRLKRFKEKRRLIPTDDAAQIMARICDAVAYAHQRNLIHRDIKPANIMMNMENEPILMDFGIAKILGGQTHTATGATVGTALYMSPEQAQGKRADERADIYSLGVTLFEVLGGRPPFEGDSAMSIMMKHITDPVPDVRELNPETPPDLQAIIEKALEKDPNRRYQSASEMAAALRAANLSADQPAPGIAPTVIEPGVSETLLEGPAGGDTSSEPTWQGKSLRQQAAERPIDHVPVAGRHAPAPGGAHPQGQGRPTGRNMTLLAVGGIGGLLLLGCIIGAIILYSSGALGGGGAGASDGETSEPTQSAQQTAIGFPATTELTLAATQPAEPTATATEASTPTPTAPPEPYVLITSITIDNGTYVVEYETFGYTEVLPGQHVHFFFNNVSPEQAGQPGVGPWELYGGPRPFRKYTVAQRPASATQMCALVANTDHSVIQNTGNCVDLPSE